ncbi:MAG: hypothetical protein ACRENB_05890, partial [Gemmatimonadales bacterium]
MTDSRVPGRTPLRPWLPVAGVAFLALAASISGLGNQWSQDDFPLIWKNPAMHDLSGAWRFFLEPYWPEPFIQALYRPFASVSFALQWAISGGSPMLFRIASYLLYAGSAVALFFLARRLLPVAAAFAAAALFAVHPVHVESVAVAVNQAEIWVGLLACVIVLYYLRARSRGGPLTRREILVLAALYLAACLFKENALMIPGFLLLAEPLLIRTGEPWRARAGVLRLPFLVLALVAVAFYGVRTLVLRGDAVGTFAAEGFFGLDMTERGLTMLAVVPEWVRLLVWPAHLQADYSPSEIVGATGWGMQQTLGAVLLLALLLTALVSWRRAPVITFGLGWTAIALFPVSNVLVTTGIVMAERTLFLPSVGFLLAVGGAAALLVGRAEAGARVALAAGLGVLLIAGTYRSGLRHPVWQDQFTLWHSTAIRDAPLSYRARHALAEMLFLAGAEGEAEQHYRAAIALYPRMSTVYLDYANKLRVKGHCY